MQRRSFSQVLLVTVMGMALLGGASTVTASSMGPMTGTIAAIEPASQTVVVEVPLGRDNFTVGGPLSPQARLTRGAKSIQLQDLRTGDRVSVTWRMTDNGHEIERLHAR